MKVWLQKKIWNKSRKEKGNAKEIINSNNDNGVIY